MGIRHAAVVAGLALGLMSGTAGAAPIEFGYTGGFQSYTITTNGIYDIVGYGAQGGTSFYTDGPLSGNGGFGAEIGGTFSLVAGQVLYIAVGGQGEGNVGGGSGGGGGTFVVFGGSISNPLLIAGGGGGAGNAASGASGTTSSNGTAGGGSVFVPGGAGGIAGAGGSGGLDGGGGGGFLSSGTDGSGNGSGGTSYFGGLAGGTSISGGAGGFGGGGGGDNNSGGGGGGYSGGGGAGRPGPIGGGGGGSYLAAIALNGNVAASGVNSGNGYVTLDLVSATVSAVPLPASAPMFGAALLGLAGIGYAAKRKKATAAA